jgi:hypothetical protein
MLMPRKYARQMLLLLLVRKWNLQIFDNLSIMVCTVVHPMVAKQLEEGLKMDTVMLMFITYFMYSIIYIY